MSKFLATVGALALAVTLALPVAANAADRKADGLRGGDAAGMTDVSSYRRRWHGRYVGVRRGFYHRPYWRARYAYGHYRPYWRARYAYPYYRPWRRAYVGYPYWRPYYRPFYRPYYAGYPFYRPWYGPRLAFGFGFGRRWWW
jgi:hypothetical protein